MSFYIIQLSPQFFKIGTFMYHNTHDEGVIKKEKSERLCISLVISPYLQVCSSALLLRARASSHPMYDVYVRCTMMHM